MHEQMLAMQAALGRGSASPEGILEGVVVTGSWNPAEGTIEVQIGDTAAVLTDLGDSPVAIQATVLTPALGEQYGPIGGERCLLFRTQSGYSALVEHGPDDSPQAPAGEHWRVLYDRKQYPTSFAVLAYDKITNDGAVAGDDKGGRRILVGAYATIATTTGFTITLSDNGKQITMTTPGGQSLIIDDNTNTIQLQGSGNSAGNAIMNATDDKAALTLFKAAMVTAGVPNAGAIVVPTVTGSSKSFTA